MCDHTKGVVTTPRGFVGFRRASPSLRQRAVPVLSQLLNRQRCVEGMPSEVRTFGLWGFVKVMACPCSITRALAAPPQALPLALRLGCKRFSGGTSAVRGVHVMRLTRVRRRAGCDHFMPYRCAGCIMRRAIARLRYRWRRRPRSSMWPRFRRAQSLYEEVARAGRV